MLDRKKRCDQPPLRIPLRIFRRQEAPAENGEDPLLKAILAIVCLILLEDPTDCGRIVHNNDVTEWKAGSARSVLQNEPLSKPLLDYSIAF
jgi:hypothetical protein